MILKCIRDNSMYNQLPDTFTCFHESILWESIAALKLNRWENNFDHHRFKSKKGINLELTFFPKTSAQYLDWYFTNNAKLYSAYETLSDSYSKRLYLHLLSYKIGGHLSVRIPVEFSESDKELRELVRRDCARAELLDPLEARSQICFARLAVELADHEEAHQRFSRAIALDPVHAVTWIGARAELSLELELKQGFSERRMVFISSGTDET